MLGMFENSSVGSPTDRPKDPLGISLVSSIAPSGWGMGVYRSRRRHSRSRCEIRLLRQWPDHDSDLSGSIAGQVAENGRAPPVGFPPRSGGQTPTVPRGKSWFSPL